MKTSKRSLITAIAVLCVCALSLTAASFAWFTSNDSARISTLEMSVTQRSSLELTVTGSTIGWKTNLTPQMFQQAGYFYYAADGEETTILNDVSTSNFNTWIKASYDADNNNFDFAATTERASDDAQTGYWLEMPISLRSPEKGVVTINDSTFSISGDLSPALRVGYKNGTTTTIYGNPSEDAFYYQAAATDSDNFATRTELTTGTAALGEFDNLRIALSDTATDGYYTADVVFYVWVEGSDIACVNKNTPSEISTAIQFGFEKATGA